MDNTNNAGRDSSAHVFDTPATVAPNIQYQPIKRNEFRRYETKQQKDAEYNNALLFVEFLCYITGYKYKLCTLGTSMSIDYALQLDAGGTQGSKVQAVIECKSHNSVMNPSYNYILDEKNYERLKHIHQQYGVPAYLVVCYTDGMYYWQFDPNQHIELHAGGRKDRGDANDIILKVNFPCSLLTKVPSVSNS